MCVDIDAIHKPLPVYELLTHPHASLHPTNNNNTIYLLQGAQLLMMCLFTILFAAVGFLSPANRGSLMIAVLLTYVLMGSVAGTTSLYLC